MTTVDLMASYYTIDEVDALFQNYYTVAQTDLLLSEKVDTTFLEANYLDTIEIADVLMAYVTTTDLIANYYTKAEVDALIAGATGGDFVSLVTNGGSLYGQVSIVSANQNDYAGILLANANASYLSYSVFNNRTTSLTINPLGIGTDGNIVIPIGSDYSYLDSTTDLFVEKFAAYHLHANTVRFLSTGLINLKSLGNAFQFTVGTNVLAGLFDFTFFRGNSTAQAGIVRFSFSANATAMISGGAGSLTIQPSTGALSFYDAIPVSRAGVIVAPTGGVVIDIEARAAINSIRTAIKNIGITL